MRDTYRLLCVERAFSPVTKKKSVQLSLGITFNSGFDPQAFNTQAWANKSVMFAVNSQSLKNKRLDKRLLKTLNIFTRRQTFVKAKPKMFQFVKVKFKMWLNKVKYFISLIKSLIENNIFIKILFLAYNAFFIIWWSL